MTIKPIETKRDYQAAMARLEVIFDSKPGTPEGEEFQVLGIVIDKYEMELFSL
jgi:HTH-type transcriptional regulator/antitoxin HigA